MKNISVTFGCIRFIDSYRFLSDSLDKLVKNLDMDDFKILKKNFLTNGNISIKNQPIYMNTLIVSMIIKNLLII